MSSHAGYVSRPLVLYVFEMNYFVCLSTGQCWLRSTEFVVVVIECGSGLSFQKSARPSPSVFSLVTLCIIRYSSAVGFVLVYAGTISCLPMKFCGLADPCTRW